MMATNTIKPVSVLLETEAPASSSIALFPISLHQHVLFIKTSKDKFEELEKYIVKNHPYSMPAIVSLPWDDSHEPYKNWVEKNE